MKIKIIYHSCKLQTKVSFLPSYLVHLANEIIQRLIIHRYMWFLPGRCSLGLGRFVTQVWGHIKTLAGWREPSRNFFLVSGKCIPPRGVCKKKKINTQYYLRCNYVHVFTVHHLFFLFCKFCKNEVNLWIFYLLEISCVFNSYI